MTNSWNETPINSELKKEISDTFHNPDLSLIKSVVYFNGWSDYEECGGILIFRAIDDSLQLVEYGYCVMAEDNTNYFVLREVSQSEAIQEIESMDKSIEENVCHSF